MATKNMAAWIKKKQAKIEVDSAEIPEPRQGEVLIKTEAIAFHPLDAKLQINDHFNLPVYPAIFGQSVGGTVVKLGPGVTDFAIGDKIVSSNPPYFNPFYKDITHYGTFQNYAVAFARGSTKLTPGGYSMTEAVTIPTQAKVAAMAMGFNANLGRPGIAASPKNENILIWGGGSSVGGYAVQYAAQAGYNVISTASASEHARIKALGASEVYDYKDADVKANLQKHMPYRTILDCIGLPSSLQVEFELFTDKSADNIIYSMIPDVKKLAPDHVRVFYTAYAFDSFKWEENGEFIDFLWQDWLKNGIQKKRITPQAADVTVGGIENIQECLDKVLKVKGSQIVLVME